MSASPLSSTTAPQSSTSPRTRSTSTPRAGRCRRPTTPGTSRCLRPSKAASPALSDLLGGKKGFLEYRQDGQGMVASYAPIAVGGWGAITTQTSGEFFGTIRRGHQRIEVAVLALLAVASLVIVVLGYIWEPARRKHQQHPTSSAHDRT